MFGVSGFIDGLLVLDQSMYHLPRTGETIRLEPEVIAKVVEVIGCMDEGVDNIYRQRINLRMELIEREVST